MSSTLAFVASTSAAEAAPVMIFALRGCEAFELPIETKLDGVQRFNSFSPCQGLLSISTFLVLARPSSQNASIEAAMSYSAIDISCVKYT